MGADGLEPFRADPAGCAVLTDFDGTLAPIVDDPRSAQPLATVPGLLDRLAWRFGVVAVLSGRPVAFLEAVLPATVRLSGLYGLESSHDGLRRDHPSVGAWREVVADVVAASEAGGPEGMRVEPKGLSLTLHYRTRPDLESAVRDWARRQAARSGLAAREAKMSVELHPPVAVDKGTAVEALVAVPVIRAVCFLGDDVGDLPAYDALDRLAAVGVHALRVAVRSAEAPPALLERADVVVEGPAGAVAFLEDLLT